MGRSVTPKLAAYYGLPVNSGVLIVEIAPKGPADRAGLAKGDIIVGLNDSPVQGINELRSLVQKKKIGEKVTILLVRDGRRFIAELVLEKTP